MSDWFFNAREWRRIDPLALDLDGDGIETIGATGQVLFDHNGDGIRTGTGWVKGDDALLVLDRNGNGTIDNGAELFGIDTVLADGSKATDGFSALRDLDANGDGVFDSADAQFANVRVWRDLDQDGLSDAGELMTLADAGVASISLNATSGTTTLAGGNTQTATATFTRTDGSVGTAANLELAQNNFYREFEGKIAISAEAAALPTVQGSGNVRDLREAMTLSGGLAGVIGSAGQSATRDAMWAQMDGILHAWADTAGMTESLDDRDPLGETGFIYDAIGNVRRSDNLVYSDATVSGYVRDVDSAFLTEEYKLLIADWSRKIHILESFNGQYFFELPSGTEPLRAGALGLTESTSTGGVVLPGDWPDRTFRVSFSQAQLDLLQQSYDALKESVYSALVVQTRLRPYLDAVTLNIGLDGITFDTSGVAAKLDALALTDERNALIDLIELNRFAGETLRPLGWDGLNQLRSWVERSASSPTLLATMTELGVTLGTGSLQGGAKSDILFTQGGNDSLYGRDGDDLLSGGAGNDYLYGEAGNDVLDGGAGNDYVSGGAGNDVYRFGRGAGADTVYNYDTTAGKTDAIELAADVAAADVRAVRVSDDLVLTIAGTTDKLTVQSYFSGDAAGAYKVEEIRFADGSKWDVATVKTLVQQGTTGADTVYGYASADVLDGLEGNDTLYGRAGNDTLAGSAGDDRLHGEDGDDLLEGGLGNDYAYGGNGADLVRGGDGNDYVYGDAGNDVLEGGAGNDYVSGGAGNDVYRFGRGAGVDTVYNYDTTAGKTDAIELAADVAAADVRAVRVSDDLVLTIAGTTDKLTVQSYFSGDAAGAYKVEEIRFADGSKWDVATVKALVQQGTTGADTLYGYATSDVLDGLEGNDTLYGRAGNDTLAGSAGDDRLYGEDGDDLLEGGLGNDYAYGGNGADLVRGGDGNDYVYGDAGNDVLEGGAGNDYVSGGAGNDVYRFGRGAGVDTVYNYDTTAGKTDAIELAADVAAADVRAVRVSDDLVLTIAGTTDKLTVQSYFNADAAGAYKVEEIRFADGSKWDVATVKTLVQQGTTGADTVYGYASADVLDGLEGNDTLYGRAGNDTLAGSAGDDRLHGEDGDDLLEGGLGNDYAYGGNGADLVRGGDGNDYVYGDAGNDVLEGGAGNDYVSGGAGNDVYRFGRGAGVDTVSDYDTMVGNTDVLEVMGDVGADQLWFRRVGNNLEVSIIGTSDLTMIGNWYSGAAYHVEQIKSSDGKVLVDSKVEALVSAMAAFAPPAAGQTSLSETYQNILAPVIAANWQ